MDEADDDDEDEAPKRVELTAEQKARKLEDEKHKEFVKLLNYKSDVFPDVELF